MWEGYSVKAIVAMARNRVIGDGEGLLWHVPGDLPRVKRLTMGCPLIMGRRTFLSIGGALSGRLSVVLSRRADWQEGWSPSDNKALDGEMVVASGVEDALERASSWISADEGGDEARKPEIIIFGGGEIYRAFMPYTDRIDMTEVDLAPVVDSEDGGVFFPELDMSEWREVSREVLREERPPMGDVAGDAVGHAVVRLERCRP